MQAAECLGKDFLNKLYMPKQMGKDQLYDLELEVQLHWRSRIESLGISLVRPIEIMDVVKDREVWRPSVELLPYNPCGKADDEKRARVKI